MSVDRLVDAFDQQRRLQIDSYGHDPKALDDEDKIEFIRWNVLALEDELHEALAEVGWKPWATSRHINREAYVGELVDAFHFFMNLCLAVGVDGRELYARYMIKRDINAARQANGYDGLFKCASCRRALDTIPIEHHKLVQVGSQMLTVCSEECYFVFVPDETSEAPRG